MNKNREKCNKYNLGWITSAIRRKSVIALHKQYFQIKETKLKQNQLLLLLIIN